MNTLLVFALVLLLIPNVMAKEGMTAKEATKDGLGKNLQMADKKEVGNPKGLLILFFEGYSVVSLVL